MTKSKVLGEWNLVVPGHRVTRTQAQIFSVLLSAVRKLDVHPALSAGDLHT